MGDNWETILDVCDKVKAYTAGPRDCLKAILRRLNHPNPHVAKQAVIVSMLSGQLRVIC
jgi:signal transducing adaptor molecule